MKTSVRFLAVAVALLVVASTAMAQNQERGRGQRGQAQGRRFGGGFGGGDPSQQLLRNEGIQKELEISEEQKEQLTKAGEEMGQMFRDLRDQELSREEMMTKFREAGEKVKTKINEILLPHQKDRLAELVIQYQGIRALTQNAAVAEKLNLSEEQKEKIGEAIGRGGFGGFGGGRRGGDREGDRPEGERLSREEREKKALDVLTAEQKEQYEKMQGKKSEAIAEMRANFGRGGFGRGGEGQGRNRGEGRGGEGRGRGRGEGEGRGAGEGRAPRDA